MGFKTGLVLGIAIGYALGARFGQSASNPSAVEPAGRGKKLVDGAARVGLDAVQRARATIQSRLGAVDDPTWN